MIKFKYAKDENEKLINIDSLNEENRFRSKFFCISCGKELIAKLGKIKIHHFAHKKVVTCSGETYLHLLGKKLFYENYTECLNTQKPFIIELYKKRTCNHFEKELNFKCKLQKTLNKFNLIEFFDKISIEKREGSFIPDLMLTGKNNKDKIFIEIAVTHFSTEKKLNSNYRIIEFEIKNDEDFEPINKKYLRVEDSRIKFKNFKSEINTSICNGECQKDFNLFTLDKDGRCLLKQKNLKQIKKLLETEYKKIVNHVISNDYGHDYPEIFKKGVADFSNQNFKVKNCFVCRYHAENHSWYDFEDIKGVPIYCKFLKIKCNSNQAVNCQYFKLEKNYVQEILTVLTEYISKNERYFNKINDT
ncbi:hypothetical protein ACSVH5_03595 [Flavobacterium sp. RSSA_27]|uniref:competence protein CoiA family protein n=1 Tax=Flavobacterium sp. RSSA_27 TaxID=3447667 RepID=UPI003F4156C4